MQLRDGLRVDAKLRYHIVPGFRGLRRTARVSMRRASSPEIRSQWVPPNSQPPRVRVRPKMALSNWYRASRKVSLRETEPLVTRVSCPHDFQTSRKTFEAPFKERLGLAAQPGPAGHLGMEGVPAVSSLEYYKVGRCWSC
jgi:hypothetical protein